MFLSRASLFGILGIVLALPTLINLSITLYLTLGFLVMTFILFKDITPAVLYANAQQNNMRKLVNFFVSSLFSALMIALIYSVSFYWLA